MVIHGFVSDGGAPLLPSERESPTGNPGGLGYPGTRGDYG